MSSKTEEVWETAVEMGVIPISGNGTFTHDDLMRALAFGLESATPTGPNEHYHMFSARDLQAYVSIRGAKCEGGQEVRDRLLRRMEAAMSPAQRRMVDERIAEVGQAVR